VVCSRCKLLGRRYIQGSLGNFLSPIGDGLACSRLASRRRLVRGVTQKRYGRVRLKVGVSFTHANGGTATAETEVRAHT
jgi:hypothetical protein